MMNTEKDNSRSLETAREYVKLANNHALYKRTEGYDEDKYSFFDVLNLDACLEICNRGPADYYYEKAYNMLCDKLGADHPETRQLVHEIINYHVNNAKRMMVERFFFTALLSLPILMMLIREIYGATWQGNLAYIVSYSLLFLLWNLETSVISFLEKRQYKKQYQNQEKACKGYE